MGEIIAKDIGSLSLLALIFGLWVVLQYGIQRNAMPDFSGDEWLPQLISIGISGGLMVALLVCLPGLDVHVYSSIQRQLRMGAHRPPVVLVTFLMHRVMAQSLSGLLLVMLVFSDTAFNEVSVQPILVGIMTLGMLFDMALALTGARAEGTFWGRWPGWGEAAIKLFGLQVLQLGLLAWLWLIVAQRFHLDADWKVRMAWVLVVLGLAGYRACFLLFFLDGGATRVRLHFLLLLATVISALFAPEILRVAGLANLPGARLQVELATARTVVEHLSGADKAGSLKCEPPQQDSADDCTVRLTVDVINRAGSTYLLAAPGTLADRKAGTCAGIHAQGLVPQSERFACIHIPRDAVKAVLR